MSEEIIKPKPKPRWVTVGIYALVYHQMIPAAKEKGYALTIHGSMSRDLDLVAVPWVEDAVTPEELAKHLAETIGWIYRDDKGCPGKKPLGRLGFTLCEMESGMWIDLAVMPGLSEDETLYTKAVAGRSEMRKALIKQPQRAEAAEAKLAEEKARQTIVARNLKDAWGAQVSALKEENGRLREELGNIANADTRKWDEEVRDQFKQWAQNRARHALTPPSKEASDGK